MEPDRDCSHVLSEHGMCVHAPGDFCAKNNNNSHVFSEHGMCVHAPGDFCAKYNNNSDVLSEHGICVFTQLEISVLKTITKGITASSRYCSCSCSLYMLLALSP